MNNVTRSFRVVSHFSSQVHFKEPPSSTGYFPARSCRNSFGGRGLVLVESFEGVCLFFLVHPEAHDPSNNKDQEESVQEPEELLSASRETALLIVYMLCR